ncbi:MAG: ABC transporter permease subunit [Proteobacteria bacterium]|nr:MAG: ABC transporter permease subunit [Pseudomonadota bacterium]
MRIFTYVLKRLLAIIPTLFGITVLTFVMISVAPGNPLEQAIGNLKFGTGTRDSAGSVASNARDQSGVSNEVMEALRTKYGLEDSLPVRYGKWVTKLVRLDFGNSFIYNRPVTEVIKSRLPVSLQFGLFSFLFTYAISVSLGLLMARRENQRTDRSIGVLLLIAAAIPGFVFALAVTALVSQGPLKGLFPLAYLTSENYDLLSFPAQILDRAHHFALPLFCYTISGLAGLAFLTRNSLLSEANKDYVRTARAMGFSNRNIYFKHILRNALIPISTGIGGFLGIFLSGSLLIESIFQLEGIGLLSFRALLTRDYNLIMGLAFLQSLALLFGNLLGDIVYMLIDPRIDLTRAP